jgi:hypothetical protein
VSAPGARTLEVFVESVEEIVFIDEKNLTNIFPRAPGIVGKATTNVMRIRIWKTRGKVVYDIPFCVLHMWNHKVDETRLKTINQNPQWSNNGGSFISFSDTAPITSGAAHSPAQRVSS